MIAVWFSCGVASAVAAKITIEKYQDVRVINSPVIEEDSDNIRFLHDVEKWIGQKIEIATNPKYPSMSAVEVWDKRKYMSGTRGAPCTLELKKEARRYWEQNNKADWHVLGFTADERNRHERFIQTERDNVLPVLIDAGITKAECFEIVKKAGIKRPAIYDLGYPNANCIGCVKATSPTYWNHVRDKHPDIFNHRSEQSRRLGARLVRVNNERIYLDELKTSDIGRSIKSYDFECGVFCEERVK